MLSTLVDTSVDTFWDDETLQDIAQCFAQCFGNSEPSEGECRNIRQQIKDKLARAKKGTSVTTDGKRIFTNGDSLTLAFQQRHVERDIFTCAGGLILRKFETLLNAGLLK